jgi:hypothetical protein
MVCNESKRYPDCGCETLMQHRERAFAKLDASFKGKLDEAILESYLARVRDGDR